MTSVSTAEAVQCTQSGGAADYSGSHDTIYVYVEGDFAKELRESSDVAGFVEDNALSEADVQGVVMEAISVWNTQSDGPSLVYNGWVNTAWDDPELACQNAMVQRPAVFVNFHPGCKPEDLGDPKAGCKGAWGNVKKIPGCSDAAWLTIYGNQGVYVDLQDELFGGGDLGVCSSSSQCVQGFTCYKPLCDSSADCAGGGQSIRYLPNHTLNSPQYVFPSPYTATGEMFPPGHRTHGNASFGNLNVCDNASCSSYTQVASHYNVTTAWDPETSLSVTAFVDADGYIRVYAGYDDHHTISHQSNQAVQTTSEIFGGLTIKPSLSGGYEEWEYLGKTRAPVGLACSETWRTGLYYNCVLAWTDYGVPNSKILYTYFRITGTGTSKSISWYTESMWGWPFYRVWELTGSDAKASVTAAYFNNALHLAWARAAKPSKIETIWTDSGYAFPSYNRKYYTEYNVVTGPTFTARDGNEAALIWTEPETLP